LQVMCGSRCRACWMVGGLVGVRLALTPGTSLCLLRKLRGVDWSPAMEPLTRSLYEVSWFGVRSSNQETSLPRGYYLVRRSESFVQNHLRVFEQNVYGSRDLVELNSGWHQ
jgi:hypothetical protein